MEAISMCLGNIKIIIKQFTILQVTGHEAFTFIFCKHCWDNKNVRSFLTLTAL